MTKQETENQLIQLGYINKFKFYDENVKKDLLGHPHEHRVYRLIKDNFFGYRIHIGSDFTTSGIQGILLGDSLCGNYDNRWEYDISIITKDNFIDFNIHPDDLNKIMDWFSSDNNDVKQVASLPVSVATPSGDFVNFDENNKVISSSLDSDPIQQFISDIKSDNDIFNKLKYLKSNNIKLYKDFTSFVDFIYSIDADDAVVSTHRASTPPSITTIVSFLLENYSNSPEHNRGLLYQALTLILIEANKKSTK